MEPQNLEDLLEKTSLLLDDPQQAEEMGAKGPELAQQYDIQILGDKLMNIYREFI